MKHTCTFALTGSLLLGSVFAQNQGVSFVHGLTDEHIDVPMDGLTIPAAGITVEAWFTYDDAAVTAGTTRSPTLLRHTDALGAESYALRVLAFTNGSRNLSFAYRNGTALNTLRTVFSPGQFTSTWTHVAATLDGQTLTLYLNGVAVSTRPNSVGPIVDGGGSLRIGNGNTASPGTEVWSGAIDEVRIWPFARTQAEIQDTMNDTLLQIPNGVTFNLDGNFIDTSAGLVGVPTANVPFVTGAPGLTVLPTGAGRFGTGSTTCANDRMYASVGSKSTAGNLDFALIAAECPPNAMGGVLLATSAAGAPLPLLGVDLWVDPATLLPIVPAVSTDGTGFARLPIALASSTQIGLGLNAQFLFLDACGTFGLVSTHGLSFAVF